MAHKSLALGNILSVLLITLSLPMQASWSNRSSDTVALFATGLISGLLGACGMHLYHQSGYKKDFEAQREKNIVTEAATVKELLIDDNIFFSNAQSSSYCTMATSYTRAERALLEVDVEHNLQAIEAQKEQLNRVTGRYGVDGKITRQQARAVYAQLVAQEKHLLTRKAILTQLNENREKSLDLMSALKTDIEQLLSNALSSVGLVRYLRKAYGTHTTNAGLKGFPLVCAIEYFDQLISTLNSVEQKLHTHLLLVESDTQAQDALQKMKRWKVSLKEILQTLNNDPHLQREASYHTEQVIALLNAQAERNRSNADLARREADRTRTKTELLREQNQAAELQTRQMEAQAACIKGLATATNRIIAACFTCPDHGRNCYHHCTHYRTHRVECSHCHE